MQINEAIQNHSTRAILAREAQEQRVRNPDGDTLKQTVHQLELERIGIAGRPQTRVMFALLAQHDKSDVNIVVNVLKKSIFHIVRNPRYYIFRYHRLRTSVRLIRLVWLTSRFRFAKKIQKLIRKWEHDEAQARKEFYTKTNAKGTSLSAANRRVSGDAMDYLSIEAPLDLKRRVFISQYKRMLDAYLTKWRAWRKQKSDRDNTIRDAMKMHPSRRDAILKELAPLPKEPDFKWYPTLMNLTHEQRFAYSLSLQRGTDLQTAVQKLENDGNVSGAKDFQHRHGMTDAELREMQREDKWMAGAMAVVSTYETEVDGRAMEHEHQVFKPKNKYAHVASKLFSDIDVTNTTSNEGGGGSRKPKEAKAAGADQLERGVVRGSLEGLKQSLPTLSRFKGDPWHMPPRPLAGGFLKRDDLHRNCDPASLSKLDPMARSLATRGITSAPRGNRVSETRRQERERTLKSVGQELKSLPAAALPPREMLRSRRALEITLGIKVDVGSDASGRHSPVSHIEVQSGKQNGT